MWIERAARSLLRKPRRMRLGAAAYFYDFRRFVAASSALGTARSSAALNAQIVKEYHRLEKGMSLAEPRKGFGADAARHTMGRVAVHEARYGPSHATREARACLRAYREVDGIEPNIAAEIDTFLSPSSTNDVMAGVTTLWRSDILSAAGIDFDRFVAMRRSIRQFTGDPVDPEAIRHAVRLAMTSPRVCNRGATRVHVAYTDALKAKALSFQNGNHGFGEKAGAVLIVTTNLCAYTDFGERNQMWIDGGLFVMTLVYALHARGLGTCFLNWSVLPRQDTAMRRAMGIPEEEAVITMVAVGNLPESLPIAYSPREPFERVLNELDKPLAEVARECVAVT